MKTRMLQAEGHLIDSGILSSILNTILAKGGDYRITSFSVGKTPEEISHLEIELSNYQYIFHFLCNEVAILLFEEYFFPYGLI